MKKGVRSWVLVIPIIVLTFLIQLGLIINASIISSKSQELSVESTRAAKNISEITSLQAGSSILSETATAFAYLPEIPGTDTPNLGPLLEYANEYKNKRRPKDVLSNLKKFGVDEDIKTSIETAGKLINEMMKIQFQSIALIESEYDIDNEDLKVIPKYELTAEEQQLTKDEKIEKALKLLTDASYAIKKRDISREVNKSLDTVRQRVEVYELKMNDEINVLKNVNWIFTIVIFSILTTFFLIIIVYIIAPISKSAKLIESDELIPIKGFYENRVFAKTYNELATKKIMYERKLEKKALTDDLTGAKNRNALNLLFQEPIPPSSIVLFVFDVNNLKQINDEKGHVEGDKLIVRTSQLITNVFDINDTFVIYRYGGDEFIVVLKDINQKEIEKIINNFIDAQFENNISIACGYEFEEDGSNTSYLELFKNADRKMYVNKNSKK